MRRSSSEFSFTVPSPFEMSRGGGVPQPALPSSLRGMANVAPAPSAAAAPILTGVRGGTHMRTNELRELLEGVQSGRLSVDAALERVEGGTVADLGFAHVDLHRRQRCGFPEVIFCEGKTPEWVEGVVRKLVEARQDCLATRVSAAQAEHLAQHFPQAQQDRVARTFWLPAPGDEARAPGGKVFVL